MTLLKEELIDQIARLVLAELNSEKTKAPEQSSESVELYAQKAQGDVKIVEEAENEASVTFHPIEVEQGKRAPIKTKLEEKENKTSDKEAQLAEMRKLTQARIAVGRAGSRPKTDTWLKFRFDHAAAVDAVYGEVSDDLLERLELFKVQTKVKDKEEYIRRPDLGRRLSDEAKEELKTKCKHKPVVQIVASNGLSASALETNLEDVYLSLKQSLANLNIETGTSFYVDKGRVALMDDIGELLEPDVVIMLIGERPGLVSAESLSAYLCYQPRHGMIEADRMVISNIHKGGIPPVEAGAYLGTVIEKVLKYEASGVSLVQKEG